MITKAQVEAEEKEVRARIARDQKALHALAILKRALNGKRVRRTKEEIAAAKK